ncbi:MAG: diacylglycerol kinase family protein [Ferruginibacter sp.]
MHPAAISIFVNPASGKPGAAVKFGKWIASELENRKISFQIFEKDWPAALDNCGEAWIVGGDGTINYFLNKYREIKIPLAFFKAGTGNDLFWKLYGDMPAEQHLEHVLNAAPQPIDAATCNNKIYTNSSGVGFDGEVLRSIDSIRWLGGHIGYLLLVIKNVFSYKEPFLKITTGKNEIHDKFLLASVNNSSRTGGGFLITPQASLTDGKLDLMLCKPLPVWKRLKYLPLLEKGDHIGLPFFETTQHTEVIIDCEKELYAQLDGELISAKTFHYKILPGYLLVRY